MEPDKGSRGRRAVLAVAVCLACPLVGRGGTLVQWDPNSADGLQGGSGTWSTSAPNWDDGVARRAWNSANGDTAVFGGAAGGTVTQSASLTAGAVQFDTAGFTIGTASSPTLTISSGSVTANADAIFAGPIATSVPLVKSGAGTLTLLGNNAIRTGVTVTGGLLSFNAESSLGAAANRIDLLGGGIRYAGPSARTLTSTRTVTVGPGGGTIDTATSLTLATDRQLGGAGDLTKAGAQTLSLIGDNPDFTGAVTVKAGTLRLGGALAINRAAVTLAGGTLALRGNESTDMVRALTVTRDATVDVDALQAGSVGVAHAVGDVGVNVGATLTFAATYGHTLAARDLNLAGGLRIADTSAQVAGSLNGGGTVFFGDRGRAVEGTAEGLVLTGGGARAASAALTADPGGRAVVSLTNGTALAYGGAWTGHAAAARNAVNLFGGSTFAVAPAAQINTLAADGASANAFVVTGAGTGETFDLGAGFVADRGGSGTFAGLASLEVRGATLVTRSTAALPVVTRADGSGGTHRAGSINFSAAPFAAAWHVTGADQRYDGGVTIAAPVTIRTDTTLTHAGVATGRADAQFQLPGIGVTLVKAGPGTLRLAGDQGYAPGSAIQIDAGAVRFDTDPAAGWYAGNFTRAADGSVASPPMAARTLAVVVGHRPAPGVANTAAQFAAPLARLASLAVNAGGTARLAGDSPAGGETLVVSGFDVTTGGVVDLASGRLVIDYDAAAPSPFADVALMARDGRLAGGAALPAARPTAVGYAEASDLFKGIPIADRAFGNATAIDDTAVLGRVTYVGDADLDGHVTFADYQRLQAGYGKPAARWSLGDFNYDGLVNTDDFLLFYRNLDPASVTPAEQQAIDAFAGTVPEPGCALWLAGAALAVRRRTRRRT